MAMGIEYSFMLFLVLGKDMRHQCLVLFGSSWFAIARQVLTKVDKHTRGFCRNLCNATAYLVSATMDCDIHLSFISIDLQFLFQ